MEEAIKEGEEDNLLLLDELDHIENPPCNPIRLIYDPVRHVNKSV